ncbi:MAG: hypothetical protein ABI565_05410, partial [Vicinamibacteria bacterium]
AERLTRGRLPFEEAARITRQIIEALAAAHRRGLVHRDIKPSNVLIDAEGQIHVAPTGALVVVVAPFSADDPTTANDGRTIATLIQDEIERSAAKDAIFIVGPGDSDRSPGTESGARKLRDAQGAAMVVWGRIFKLGNRTDIEARLTGAAGAAAPSNWPEPLSVDDSKQGLEARRQLAQAIAAAVAGSKR